MDSEQILMIIPTAECHLLLKNVSNYYRTGFSQFYRPKENNSVKLSSSKIKRELNSHFTRFENIESLNEIRILCVKKKIK